MRDMNKIIAGSRAFFAGLEGFNPKDTDVIIMVEPDNVQFQWMRQISDGFVCTFEIVRHSKQELIEHAVEKAAPMAIGRFLTPDFANEIGLTVEDLAAFRPMRDALDDKHKYLRVIYDAYIENGSFTLTDELRQAAYAEYKAERADKEKN